ncbi:TRAP transporter large permease subunit [Aliiruegeria lutimaris]|uniref:Tripartite ATP-independent transporter, DctM component n=1 Tax=Aliiruegeria lutimaris TaxID=571298 RepID=A0A1G8IHG4_9RHOB|nr:TRAP transporter large permease subunit [Aliiruegeria lutimaris]SDI18344.1 Tripartite ATP-independent transporter, DctM component [Aliiruegeria lutimaris]
MSWTDANSLLPVSRWPVHDALSMVPGGLNGQIVVLPLLFVLGFFLERIAILVAEKLETSFLTPPFGWALLFLKGVALSSVTTADIYRGVVPFIGLQLFGLAMVFFFPGLANWLPEAIG